MQRDPDVLILGAGMAGLVAARALAEAGLHVLVLEASNRTGGRIHTLRTGTEVVELGAEFLHGKPPDLWALVEEANLHPYERIGDFLRLDKGELLCEADDENDTLDALIHYAGPDRPFTEYLATLDLPEEERQSELGYVEGFNAADATEASILALGQQQQAENAIEGDRVWRIAEGYGRLPDFLRERAQDAGASILLDTPVCSVLWTPNHVEAQTPMGRTFSAPAILITVPLGVLQSDAFIIAPLPLSHAQAIANLRMGNVCRFTLVFNRRLWPEGMSFLLTSELQPSVWWTAHPAASFQLTGWTGGPRSLALLALAPAQLRALAIQSIAQAMLLDEAEVAAALVSLHTHDWTADPHTRGAYSWVPVGGIQASATLAQPIQQTIFFAGEHTDISGHWGTVHAAYRSGLRAAQQLLAP